MAESKVQLERVLSGLIDGVARPMYWRWSLDRTRASYDTHWLDTLGYSSNQIADSTEAWTVLAHPDDTDQIRKFIENIITHSSVTELTARFFHRDGSLRYFRFRNGELSKSEGTFVFQLYDITAIMMFVLKCATYEGLNSVLAAKGTIGTFTYAISEKHLEFSPSVRTVLALEEKRELAKSLDGFLSLVCPADRSRVRRSFESAITTPGSFSVEFKVDTPEGNFRKILLTGESKGGGRKSADLLLGVLEDRTELESLRERMMNSAKMATLGQMAAGIGHEINNPLTTITGTIGQVRRLVAGLPQKGDVPEVFKKLLDRMEETSFRIAKIVTGLRTFVRSGAETGQPIAVELNELISDTLHLCGERLKNHEIDLQVDCSSNLKVKCRQTQVMQVLMNLLSNAVDAIDDLKGVDRKWIRIAASAVGDNVQVVVTDCGPGLSVELSQKILQPFFTTKRDGRGTGLGLSIAVNIVRAHGGDLYVDHGSPNTCFVFTLPAYLE